MSVNINGLVFSLTQSIASKKKIVSKIVILSLIFTSFVISNGFPYITRRANINTSMSEQKESRGRKTPSFGVHMDSPSAERNKSHIWKVLSTIFQKLEKKGNLQIIEIAAGTSILWPFLVESSLFVKKI